MSANSERSRAWDRTWKRWPWFVVALLCASIIVTVEFVAGSYVSFEEPRDAMREQNFYIARTFNYGVLIAVFNAIAIALVLIGRGRYQK